MFEYQNFGHKYDTLSDHDIEKLAKIEYEWELNESAGKSYLN